MNFIVDLFTHTGAVSHIVFLYALVIAIGVFLGRIKIAGISLGTTFVLFVGILAGHLYTICAPWVALQDGGYAAPLAVMNFISDFGLILFVYCVGLQVGPGFFQSFKTGGMQMNTITIGIVVLNLAVMLGLYYLFCDTSDPKALPMMVGVLSGAVTNTPGLGAAQEAVKSLSEASLLNMGDKDIASGYACAYPLGVIGIIGTIILLRFICRIKLQEEEEELQREQENNPHAKPFNIKLRVANTALEGKTFAKMGDFLGRTFVCTQLRHNGEIISPTGSSTVSVGDEMNIVCAEDDAEAVTAFIGPKVEGGEWKVDESLMVTRRIVVTKSEVNGKTFGQMHFSSIYGVNITRITRNGMELFADRSQRLQIGDRLTVVGPEENVKHVASRLGNSVKRLDHPNIGSIFIGICLGIILGSIPFFADSMQSPLKLGLAGGTLIVAILMGAFGYKLHLVSYATTSANLLLREIGLILFLASVGIKAGSTFWETVVSGGGLSYVWMGFIITVVPLLIMGIIARKKFKFNYFTLCGILAGSTTDPPALGYSSQLSESSSANSASSVGYSTVYPMAMFLRILTAQMLILFLCS